ncbi:CAR11 [Symbiodinium sp. CCMP2592]|nr:CAR11 [Symbiodinium sp. CCMP2592]
MVQLLVAIGPLMSYTASYLWCFHREDTQISEMLAPLAYISNGLALGCMTIFVHVEEQENGAMVPFSFRGVLYLDVFGWLSHRQDSEGSPKEEAVALRQEMSPSSKLQRDSLKPAASAVQYDCYGNSLPCKAADSGKPGSLEDLRYLPGAPRAWDTVNAIEPPAKDYQCFHTGDEKVVAISTNPRAMNVPFLPLLLSKSARRRLLDEMQQHVLEQCTKDPAMPDALQSLITSLVRVFWADMVVELELDASSGRRQEDDEEESTGSLPQGPLGRALSPWLVASSLAGSQQREEELAAAPDIATGILQVLVVEARDLVPVHGIGTNPYVRGRLGQQVRRSRTVWSNLRPAWNCLMEFPVVSTRGNLELEVMSRAPLFGGDTRLGYVSLSLDDITSPAAVLTAGPGDSQLAYRCEPLLGAQKGELVLIMDYKKLQAVRRRLSCGAFGNSLLRRAAQFRAFFLYHYWPCDKSIFQMYMHEPIDICLLLLSLSPFVFVRVLFYTVLLLCLCVPWPPDEHQIVQFILACKGTAIISDGAGRVFYGIFMYYLCAREGTCSSGGAPGTGVSFTYVALDLYQEVLVWAVCFLILPRSLPYLNRGTGASGGAGDAQRNVQTEDVHRGGRMQALLQYNMLVFAISFAIFLTLSARDLMAFSWDGRGLLAAEAWRWRVAENFFWARAIFGLCMCPFLFLLHPQINKLLTHSTPTGYTRLGTLKRHRPILRPKRPAKSDTEIREVVQAQEAVADSPSASPKSEQEASLAVKAPVQEKPEVVACGADRADPIGDLQTVVRRLPGGSLALKGGSFCIWATGRAAKTAVTVVSLEIRVASAAVSLGLRAADAGRTTVLAVARRVVPGSDTAVVRFARARAEGAEQLVVALVRCCDRALQGPVAVATRIAGHVPGGRTALSVLGSMCRLGGGLVRTCYRMAAVVESPGEVGSSGECEQLADSPLGIQAGLPTIELLQAAGGSELVELSEKAELVKLEAAARLAELLTRAERLAEREVAEAREALQRVQPEISKISQALRDRSQGWAWELQRARGTCESMCRSTVAWTSDLAGRLPVAGQVLLGAFRRELQELQEQGRAERTLLQTLEAYSRVLCSSACEAVLELRPQHALATTPTSPAFGNERGGGARSRGGSPLPTPKAPLDDGEKRSYSLPRKARSEEGIDINIIEVSHGNTAPKLPEVRRSGVSVLGAMRRLASPRQWGREASSRAPSEGAKSSTDGPLRAELSCEVPSIPIHKLELDRERERRRPGYVRSEPCSPPTVHSGPAEAQGPQGNRASLRRDQLGRPPRPSGTPRVDAGPAAAAG